MHLLPGDLRSIDDAGAAIDLGQTPADIIFLSFSDSELRLLARLHESDTEAPPSLRCAPLAQLKHPYSVDLYLETVAREAKLIVVRLLGGKDYWAYGVDQLAALARIREIKLAIVPGDIVDDARLNAAATLDAPTLRRIWRFFQDGGADNLRNFLRYAATLIGQDTPWRESAPIPAAGLCDAARRPQAVGAPRASIVFYRSLYLADDLAPVSALADALAARDFAVDALYVGSLKEPESDAFVSEHFNRTPPDIVINTTVFSAWRDGSAVLDRAGAPVLQAALATSPREVWEASARGANGADLAMNIVLPEVDGRMFTRAISFKEQAPVRGAAEFNDTRHAPDPSRIAFVADLARNWMRLRRLPNAQKNLALILSNYPARRGRGGYAIGLDVEASAERIVDLLQQDGYDVAFPETRAIVRSLEDNTPNFSLSHDDYLRLAANFPADFMETVNKAWGAPEEDRDYYEGAFRFSCIELGNLVIALQPDRGERASRMASYHDTQSPPRHHYLAFYLWLRYRRGIDALIHLGAHGTLEWLPGKSVMLSAACAPEVVLGPTPLVYPFIVNDPGEAAQAKRRTAAVTIGHLTPPLCAAGLTEATARIETLLDEYANAATLDPRRARLIAETIIDSATRDGLADEAGIASDMAPVDALTRLDAWMCDLKEMRIGDGLHIFGAEDANSLRNICGLSEGRALLDALAGRFVTPGPAGAPSRGRTDVLPTGRNIYCIDPRHAPTQTAFDIGRRIAAELVTRHLQEQGDYPHAVMLDLWGSATIRTGGEDFAQALALMGVRPTWDNASARVIGFEILPQARCDFPRIDVTLHVSGLFRDMFPGLIALFDDAVRAIAALEEDPSFNPLRGARDLNRIFGAASGEYGLGVSAAISGDVWRNRDDLGDIFLAAAGHALNRDGVSAPARASFEARVAETDLHVHVRDMAEVDVLTGPAFVDFEGGFAAANAMLGGNASLVHVDTVDPEAPRTRPLGDEIARTLRMRLANPQWINSQMRHGYRGASEIAEGVDNLYAFAATTGLVRDAQFERAFDAILGDNAVREFMARVNPRALEAAAQVFRSALNHGLWRTRRNSVAEALDQIGAPYVTNA
jgi:cobaltochelatase CobN